jgi:dUTP pyrophosphatase
MRENSILGYYRLSHFVKPPTFATPGSAAFDLRAFFDGSAIKGYDNLNNEILTFTNRVTNSLEIYPRYRYMIPTGLIFDIEEGYVLEVNMRGGTGLKKGLCLANDTGIVDWDYTKETYVLVVNTTDTIVLVENEERIAQARLKEVVPTDLFEMVAPPSQKTSRFGGFNSTGTK